MKKDIILSGVGGQGILSIASVIGLAAMNCGLHLKQSEVHGMSQRGGDVQSHLRISDQPISSDLIPINGADMIISVEPMEALRYLPWLSKEGWIITNTNTFENIPNYPAKEDVLAEVDKIKNHVLIDADDIAADLMSPRSGNMVVLGAASLYLDIPYDKLEEAVKQLFAAKGDDVVDKNVKALAAGRKVAEQNS